MASGYLLSKGLWRARIYRLQAAQQQIQTAIQAANSSSDGGSSGVSQQQELNVDPAAVNVSTCTDVSTSMECKRCFC